MRTGTGQARAAQAAVLSARVLELEDEANARRKHASDLEAGLRMTKLLLAKSMRAADGEADGADGASSASLSLARRARGDTLARERVWLEENRAQVVRDALALFDAERVRARQHFLGAPLGQHPFDATALHEVAGCLSRALVFRLAGK